MKRILIGSSVLLLLVGLALLALQQQESKPISTGSLILPDGSVVRIIAATYGTNHLVGPPLARLAYRISPDLESVLAGVFGRIATLSGSNFTPRPALVVWLDRISANGTSPPKQLCGGSSG